MEDIIKKNCETTQSLYKMLDLEPPFFSELFSFRFDPDRDQFLHWYCKRGNLYMVQMVSQWVDFHSKNKRGLVPFRCLKWSKIPELIKFDRNLAVVMLQSDPDCIVGRNCDLILQEGFEQFISQPDFFQALSKQIPSRYSDLFQSLNGSCDEEPFELSDYVNGRTKQLPELHEHFVFDRVSSIERMIAQAGVDIHVKDGDGRVAFQYADNETLSRLMFSLPTETFTNLIKSDARTFIRLALRLLKNKVTKWDSIQFLFDRLDLFVSCLDTIAAR
jgi:hypothetical protein